MCTYLLAQLLPPFRHSLCSTSLLGITVTKGHRLEALNGRTTHTLWRLKDALGAHVGEESLLAPHCVLTVGIHAHSFSET